MLELQEEDAELGVLQTGEEEVRRIKGIFSQLLTDFAEKSAPDTVGSESLTMISQLTSVGQDSMN